MGSRRRRSRRRASMCAWSGRACSSTPSPGRRRILPPLVFGAGVLWHLIRHGRRYDAVHTCLVSVLLAAGGGLVATALGATGWSSTGLRCGRRGYWREYLGRLGGRVGWLVQRLCARVPQRAFCFSRLYAGAPARGRSARRGHRARRRVPRAARAPRRSAPPSRWWSSRAVISRRSACRAFVPAIARARASASGAAGGDPRRRPGARGGAARLSLSTAWRTSSTSRVRRDAGRRRAHRPRAVHAAALAAERAMGWSWSRLRRAAPPASSSPVPTTPPSSWSTDGVNGFVAPSASAGGSGRGDPPDPRGGPAAAPLDRGVVCRERPALSLERSLEVVAAATRG